MIKTNNTNLALKIELRRTVLKAAGFKKLHVLDLFAGGGEIWAALRQEFKVASYLPCDAKPQTPGTLAAAVTPLFIEAIVQGEINVVDIESGAEPWEIWQATARRLRGPGAVFLSHPGGELSAFARQILAIPPAWRLPPGNVLAEFSRRYFITPRQGPVELTAAWRLNLGRAADFGILCRPAGEGTNGKN